MSIYPMLVPSCIALICVDMIGSVKFGYHNTSFNPLDVQLYTILMSSSFSANKRCVRLKTSSPLLIQLFICTFKNFSFLAYPIFISLYLCCACIKLVPSSVNRSCCPFLTGFPNYYGRIQKWILDTASQPHNDLLSHLCAHSLPVIMLGSPTRFLAAFLYATLPLVRHLQIPHVVSPINMFSSSGILLI